MYEVCSSAVIKNPKTTKFVGYVSKSYDVVGSCGDDVKFQKDAKVDLEYRSSEATSSMALSRENFGLLLST